MPKKTLLRALQTKGKCHAFDLRNSRGQLKAGISALGQSLTFTTSEESDQWRWRILSFVLPDDLELIIFMTVMLMLLLLNCQDNRLMRSLTEISKFPGMIPQVILLVLGNPSFDQDIVWILVKVSLIPCNGNEGLTVSSV